MSQENVQISKSPESIVLDLEILNSQYSNLLIKYEQAVANYTSYMQKQSLPGAKTTFKNIPNQSFWGSEGINTFAGQTSAKCSSLCLNNSKCSGATYNATTQICSLRSGNGSLVPSTSNDAALIPEETYLLLNMQSINSQLIEINQQILSISNKARTKFDIEGASRKVQTQTLLENYVLLNKEREKIDNMVKSYEELNEDEIQGNIIISNNYYSFILLLIFSVALIVILYMFSGTTSNSISSINQPQPSGQLGISAYFIVFFITLIVVAMNYSSITSSYTSVVSTIYS
jgi:hypothetical protein